MKEELNPWNIAFAWFCVIIVFIFVGFWHYLTRTEPSFFNRLILLAGIVGALITSGWAIWFVLKTKKEYDEQLLRSDRLATIGKMSSIVAHELRNPLSSVSLNTELLQEEINSFKKENIKEAKDLLDAISSEVSRLHAITNDYLKFAKFPKPSPAETSLNKVIMDTIKFIRAEASEKKVEVSCNLDKDLPAVRVDEKQIEQALLNIIRNAFEAMPKGGNLDIYTRRHSKMAEIIIKDTGKGIPKNVIKKIFDPFFTTKARGTGLGLSLTLQIISEHEGNVYCTSEVGKGATFIIDIPLS